MQIDTGDQPVVEARFHLSEITSYPHNQSADYGTAKMVRIKMNAAKHGTFGKASPNGSLEMLIANPGAYEIFEKAFNEAVLRRYVDKPVTMTARFKVYFVLDENQEPDKY
jgi:hypothetical protein